MLTIHGTCVLVSGIGVLLRGPSGSGKSDVALRMIDAGALLVADDRVDIEMDGERLMARAPAVLAGLIEARGVGIVRLPAVDRAEIGLVIDLVPEDRAGALVERLPEPETVTLLGRPLPRLAAAAFHASTPFKLKLAAAAVASGTLGEVPVRP
jgi:serine kinase of HPr protein (carbohydrate metabolism regulator)